MYKVMSKVANIWDEKMFNNEKEARDYANGCCKGGCHNVELYTKTRGGWRLVQTYRVSRKEAIRQAAEFLVEDVPQLC